MKSVLDIEKSIFGAVLKPHTDKNGPSTVVVLCKLYNMKNNESRLNNGYELWSRMICRTTITRTFLIQYPFLFS